MLRRWHVRAMLTLSSQTAMSPCRLLTVLKDDTGSNRNNEDVCMAVGLLDTICKKGFFQLSHIRIWIWGCKKIMTLLSVCSVMTSVWLLAYCRSIKIFFQQDRTKYWALQHKHPLICRKPDYNWMTALLVRWVLVILFTEEEQKTWIFLVELSLYFDVFFVCFF